MKVLAPTPIRSNGSSPRAPSRRFPSFRRRGFSLLEVVITISVVAIAVGGAASTLLVTSNLTRSSGQSGNAFAAAQELVERIRGEEFAQVFARYNGDPADDPDGPGTAPGSGFDVALLSPRALDPDGLPGEVRFPVAPGTPGVLREDQPLLGRTIDLDLDGAIDANDKALDYALLPVEVRVDWQGPGGGRSVEIQTVLLRP